MAVSLAGMCLCFLAAPSFVAKEGKNSEATALLAKAREVSDIRASGSLPFRLHAWIDFPRAKDFNLRRGSYLENWSSPEHWRREIKGINYEEVSVRVGNSLWRKANMSYRPWPFFRLEKIFDMGQLGDSSAKVVGGVKGKKHQGITLGCVVEKSRKGFPDSTVCVNRDEGFITSIENISGKMEYADYRTFGDKSFPMLLRLSFDGEILVEMHIDNLDFQPGIAASTYEQPEGSKEVGACDEQEPPMKISGAEAGYSSRARAQKIQGTNASYVVISETGQVIHAEIVEPLEPSLDAATLDAIRRWRFRPAQCGGRPIDTGAIVQTFFHNLER